MRYFFILNHPAHFHLFKNLIKDLSNKGHDCKIFIRPKDVLEDILKEEKLNYKILSTSFKSRKFVIGASIAGLLKKDLLLSKEVLKEKPDLMIGTDWAIVHVGKIFGIPSLVFNEDDTVATPENKFFYPFAKTLLLPECCDKNMWGKKRISYNGYHELAYLHPNNFKPDPGIVLNNFDISKPVIIIRLVKLSASHDLKKRGLGIALIKKIIEKYKSGYTILLSLEDQTIPELEKYQFRFNPVLMHHFLSCATLVIGDSQTMIAEAAVLGTPSIRFNDFVGKLGYLDELEHKYDLTYGINTSEPEKLLNKIDELLSIPDLKEKWRKKREKLLNDKIDVNAFMIWFVENYPESINVMKKDPAYQYSFR